MNRQFHDGELRGDYVATKTFGLSYRQLMRSGAGDWSTVADLVAHLPVQTRERASDLSGNTDDMLVPVIFACFLGVLIGGLVGYLLVLSMPLVGKLPLMHILTRGIFLEGLDTMLVSVAETSFNYMLVCAILGGVIGRGLAYLSGAAKRESRQKSGEDIAEQLKKLAVLREQKIVTEEEFQAKKSELLKRL